MFTTSEFNLVTPRTNLELLRAIRDCQLFRGTKRRLLDSLALRSHLTPEGGFTALASVSELERDTLLGRRALLRAVESLNLEQIVTRTKGEAGNDFWLFNVALITSWVTERLERAGDRPWSEDWHRSFDDDED